MQRSYTHSLRTIGKTLFIIGALLVAGITAQELLDACQFSSGGCSASVFFGVPEGQLVYEGATDRSGTTATQAVAYPSFAGSILLLLKTLGVYLVFLGVFMLVILELMELRYLRLLLQRKRA